VSYNHLAPLPSRARKQAVANFLSAILALSLADVLLSCAHPTAPAAPSSIAVIRFENLTPDSSLDWMGRAAAEIVAREISTGRTMADLDSALTQGAATLVLGQLTRTVNGLTLQITRRDAARQRNTETFAVTDSGNLYALADAVAHRLNPQAAPFDTKNNQAIEAWAKALDAPSPALAVTGYQQAVQADPGFAAAWLAWSTTTAAQGDRAGAARILSDAQQHASAFSPIERARLNLTTAELSGNRAQAFAALNEIARLSPDDPATLRAIAVQNFAGRQYPQAVAAFRKVLQLNPTDVASWNELGYSLAYSGDYNGAIAALESYQKLAPNDANPLDSSGDVALLSGRFADAVKFYEQSAAKDPAFNNSGGLYKSAVALLLAGNLTTAQQKFDAYAAARKSANDPTLPLRQAEWLYLIGKRDAALSAVLALASSPNPQLKSAALTQAALWELGAGQRDRARAHADVALKTGAASPISLIARFASEDAGTAAGWESRAHLLPPQLQPISLAYAFYFSHLWQPAEPLFKQIAQNATQDDTVTGIFYARILTELNRAPEAAPYLRFYPIPPVAGIQEFYSIALPQFQILRRKH
jgi:Tfp pilus assembly protein PilF